MFALRSRVRSILATRMAKKPLAPGLYLHISEPASTVPRQGFAMNQNPNFVKYAAKLEHLKETQPEVYKERMEKLKALYAPPPTPEPEVSEGSSVDPPNVPGIQDLQVKKKSLNSLMKVELLEDKTTEEIETIWLEYHKEKQCVFGVVPSDQYMEMNRRTEEFPLFLYPVPRQGGYEFFIQQYSDNTYYFTTLGMYQAHKENAPACLELNFFTDLQKDNGIVLMRGEPDTNILSIYEAQLLALQIKMYYGINCGLKFNLVRMFNNDPNNFRYLDLVKEFENYKQDSRLFREEFKSDS